MRLIDADDILDSIENWKRKVLYYHPYTKKFTTIPLSEVLSFLEDSPTIDAVPVKHGEWIHGREVSRDYVGDACVCIRYEKWWCSECNYTVDLGEPLWHYCPNCGAKMEV